MKFELRQENPSLTFRRGKFVLNNPPRTIVNDPYWKKLGDGLAFETVSLRAAEVFRHLADETAEKIFRRAFQEFYEYPRLPQFEGLDLTQRAGVEWILTRKRSYLAHAPGAGKTVQAILAACLARKPGLGQVLFIVPPSLTANWEREIWKFTLWADTFPSIGVVGATENQEHVAWRADFIICPDSMLTKEWVYSKLLAMNKLFIAVDEASRFKESLSERSIAFYGGKSGKRVYPGLFQDARHVVLLDGSPMPNRPMELWAPAFALDPESIDCMDQNDFGYRYCGPRITERGQYTFDHSCREDELKMKLQESFMHVVTEDQLSHPERRRSMLFMNQDARSAEHRKWERQYLTHILNGSISEETSRGELAHFRRELGVRKVNWIASYVGERLEEKNESILLFVWHREVALALLNKLLRFKPGYVVGGTHANDREKYFAEFQAGQRRLIIGNIQAMGRGHNLQRADRVIFGEFSWTDELNKQCEKRASRRGSDKEFTRCEYIVAPDSMDEIVLKSLFTKQKRVKRIIG